jgi:hypothetical protein
VQTPEQSADDAITTLLDNALGARDRETDGRLRADIWRLIRDEQLENAGEGSEGEDNSR